MNIGFVTFAGGDLLWELALIRIKRQAKKSQVFSQIKIYKPKNLSNLTTFEDKHFIETNSRGYGYWIWKPMIILDFLSSNPEIEGILYADAGCDLNFNFQSMKNWNRYVRELEKNNVVAFKMELIERAWTKQEVFDLHPEFERHRDDEQLLGGIFLMKRNYAIDFCIKWLEILRQNNYKILDNSFDPDVQDVTFQQPRHDQSIFSLLTKQDQNARILDSLKELYFEPDWERGYDYPIWTSRNKSLIPKYSRSLFANSVRYAERVLQHFLS